MYDIICVTTAVLKKTKTRCLTHYIKEKDKRTRDDYYNNFNERNITPGYQALSMDFNLPQVSLLKLSIKHQIMASKKTG